MGHLFFPQGQRYFHKDCCVFSAKATQQQSGQAGNTWTCEHTRVRMRARRDRRSTRARVRAHRNWRMQHTRTRVRARKQSTGWSGAGSRSFVCEVSPSSQWGKSFELEETQRWFSSLNMFLRKQEWGPGKWNDLAKVTKVCRSQVGNLDPKVSRIPNIESGFVKWMQPIPSWWAAKCPACLQAETLRSAETPYWM